MGLRTFLLLAALLMAAGLAYCAVRYPRSDKRPDESKDWFIPFTTLTILNFFVFMVVDFIAGGDAWNGKVDGGQYFLGQQGTYTPVGFVFWVYSFVHAWLVTASFPGMVFGLLLRYLTGRIPFTDDDDFNPRGRGAV